MHDNNLLQRKDHVMIIPFDHHVECEYIENWQAQFCVLSLDRVTQSHLFY